MLARRGVPMHHALFIPSDSSYSKIGPRAGSLDLSWQTSLQRIWEANYSPPRSAVQVSTLPTSVLRAKIIALHSSA